MKLLGFLIDKFEEACIVTLLGGMTVINFTNIVCRWIGHSISFTEEITIIMFVWVSMFGIAAGYKKAAHLGMSFVVDKLPRKLQAVFALVSTICTLLVVYIFIRYGFEMVGQQIRLKSTTPSLRIPQYIQGLSIPVGGILIGVRAIESGWKSFRSKWTQDQREEE